MVVCILGCFPTYVHVYVLFIWKCANASIILAFFFLSSPIPEGVEESCGRRTTVCMIFLTRLVPFSFASPLGDVSSVFFLTFMSFFLVFQEPQFVLFLDLGHSSFSAAVVTFVQVTLILVYFGYF